jgi:hypothetical protein
MMTNLSKLELIQMDYDTLRAEELHLCNKLYEVIDSKQTLEDFSVWFQLNYPRKHFQNSL